MKKFAASLLLAGALSLAAVGVGSAVSATSPDSTQGSIAIGWWPTTSAVGQGIGL
ncbi:hypothetical protein [Spelaeicoccus albus]|uniref:Putative low-complexity protein n=1 Tax=Spelaeicoccus albus TaxID=1280376 RepID=A0A7Z0D4T8_9MICO|nr:hypothetical protein [Spelaeicoccus albus]NYI68893.1 putative low-complexity protein [Spelaeicoccus albus]